jgi:hypothetical protein
MNKTRAVSAWTARIKTPIWIASTGFAALMIADTRADSTYVYAVQLSATVQATPPRITLSWQLDPYGAANYTIYRKAKEQASWGTPVASLPGYVSSYADDTVAKGATYEYQVVKAANLGYAGYGYIFSGIEAPALEDRGTVVLVIAKESAAGLETELGQLQSDLIGDGWGVIRHDVSTTDSPQNVRALIMGDYNADPGKVNAVFLFGHVPILHSGYMDYDGHGPRAMPADAYYGDMNNDWPTEPSSSLNYIPSDIALMVGRVDLAKMPGNGAAIPWPGEVELLRNYLNKDHLWRFGQLIVPRRALMGNRRGDEGGLAVAASGYRNFEPLVGPANTIEANISDIAPATQRWSSMLAGGTYLWAYGCGAGQDTAIGYLGTHGTDSEAWSTDLVDWNARAVFVMVFGSHLGNWDHTDNIMRAVLATPQAGLVCCMSGEPHWFCHHMGLGETIGYSARLTINNTTLYQNQMNPFTRAAYIALMGDPTLRMEPIEPPSNLQASVDAAGVHLNWNGVSDTEAEYSVYRATSTLGPFLRLNNSLISTTNFTDVTAAPNTYTYMVRAVVLQTNFSGSYFNPSQGIFASISIPAPVGPIEVQVKSQGDQPVLTWNSQAGVAYRVQATDDVIHGSWNDLSGPITANGPSASWTDSVTNSSAHRFYRVMGP